MKERVLTSEDDFVVLVRAIFPVKRVCLLEKTGDDVRLVLEYTDLGIKSISAMDGGIGWLRERTTLRNGSYVEPGDDWILRTSFIPYRVYSKSVGDKTVCVVLFTTSSAEDKRVFKYLSDIVEEVYQ